MPSTDRLPSRGAAALGLAVGAVAVASFAGLAAAQGSRAPDLEVGVVVRFVAGLAVYGVLGAGLAAVAPSYAGERVADIRDDPVSAFVWGLVVNVGGALALFLLAITIIGLLVAIPGAIALLLVGLAGTGVTVLWIGDAVVDGPATSGAAVGVGALALAAVTAVPVLGSVASRVLGLFGVGVVGRRLYRDWRD